MNGNAQFDAIQWINKYFRGAIDLDFDHLRPILCFSLIWNLFETHACRRNATTRSIHDSVDIATKSGRLKHDRYDGFLKYFKTRYVREDKNLEWFFDALLMTEPRAKEVVRRVLNDERPDPNDHVYALLLIAHRIRNNLFHGNKSVESLPRQIDLFNQVNALLATYLEDIEASPEMRL